MLSQIANSVRRPPGWKLSLPISWMKSKTRPDSSISSRFKRYRLSMNINFTAFYINVLLHLFCIYIRGILWTGMCSAKFGIICLERRCLRYLNDYKHHIFCFINVEYEILHNIFAGGLCWYQHCDNRTVLQLHLNSRIHEWDFIWRISVPVRPQN